MNRRIHARAKVDLLINRFLDGQPYVCRVIDISPTGMRLVPVLEPKRKPRFMGLQFQLPGTETVITASGEAVNTSDGDAATGVRFTRLPAECASLIRTFVDTN